MAPRGGVGRLCERLGLVVDGFVRPIRPEAPATERRARVVVAGSFGTAAVLSLSLIVRATALGPGTLEAFGLVCAALMASAPFLMRWTGNVWLAGAVTPALVAAVCGLVALREAPGLEGPSVMALPLVPIGASLFVGARAALVFAALVLAEAAALSLYASEGQLSALLSDLRFYVVAHATAAAAFLGWYADHLHARAQSRLRASERRHHGLMAALPDMLVRLDPAGRVIDGRSGEGNVPGPIGLLLRPGALLTELLPHDVAGRVLGDIGRALAQGALLRRTVRAQGPDGERQYELRYTPSAEAEVTLLVREVTPQQAALADRSALRRTDGAAGIVSVPQLMSALEQEVEAAARGGAGCALLLVDLGALGEAGSQQSEAVVAELAQRIDGVVRPTDLVARYGVDELVVLLRAVHAPQAPADVARRILDVAARPVWVGADLGEVTLSVGVATCPGDARDADGLLAAADQALFAARGAGRSAVLRFHREASQLERPRVGTA